MMSAAVQRNGSDAERIRGMMTSDDLNMNGPFFFDLPDVAALTCQRQRSISRSLASHAA